MSEQSKHYDDTERNKPLTEAGGQVVASDGVLLADALNTVLWLERRLPKGYDEVPHVQRTKASLRAGLESSFTPTATKVIRNTKLDGVAGVERNEVLESARTACIAEAADMNGDYRDACHACAQAIQALKWAAPVAQPLAPSGAVPALEVWEGPMPESNGKSNFTAILRRKDADFFDEAHFTIARSEYPDRVRYEADCVRHIIGELAERPFILDYDDEKHSGYVAAQPLAASAAPEGFVLVPIEPTEEMLEQIEDAAKNECSIEHDSTLGSMLHFGDPGAVYKAMLDAVPRQEAKPAVQLRRQYFYKTNACTARDASQPDCVCWHEEGAGPLADDPDSIRDWHAAPSQQPAAVQAPAPEVIAERWVVYYDNLGEEPYTSTYMHPLKLYESKLEAILDFKDCHAPKHYLPRKVNIVPAAPSQQPAASSTEAK